MFKCQLCGTKYERDPLMVQKDTVSGVEYMRCPTDKGVAYHEVKAKAETKAKPKPKPKKAASKPKKAEKKAENPAK